jgi:endoglucanase
MPVVFAITMTSSANAQLPFQGVNLSGAEFGSHNLPGTYNGVGPGPYDYIYPPDSEVDYFIGKGMNTFRLPFRWERLQQSLNADLDLTELDRMSSFVDYTTGQGAHVILDPHNFAQYYGSAIGGGSVTSSHFADFWGKVATEFKNNPRVIFGLMNEPIGANQSNGITTEAWLDAANAAIAAIRATGADNLILVPGNGYSGAHSWDQNYYGTPNANVMLGVVDTGNNFAFEVHQYLDGNSSGQSAAIAYQGIGRDRLINFTQWLKQHGFRGFLGEFGAANSTIGDAANQIGDETVNLMLDYIEANDDVWIGWAWWGGGPWWSDSYLFAIDPLSNGQDQPSIGLLEPRLQGIFLLGDCDLNGDVDFSDIPAMVGVLTSGNYLAQADCDQNGAVDFLDVPSFIAILMGN